MGNDTGVTGVIQLGLPDDPHLQTLFLFTFFLTCALSITGNLTIVTLTLLDPSFCTPTYFFLGSFSLLEIAFTSVCIPRFLVTIVTGHGTISFSNCFTQLFIIFLELFLLASMSYDCYVTICRPLHYRAIMSRDFWALLVLCSWLAGFLVSFLPVIVLHHDFCSSNNNHFICASSPMLQFSCSDIWFLELMAFLLALVSSCNPSPSVLVHSEGNLAVSLNMIEMFRGLLCKSGPELMG
ncbi:olfactory receptor 6C75-like [Tachyglossus aculeatus]|uniref:olfactory receptor 6C75-like n=1 Tax=Tachyglossus aculeatus TaxID=9261 RepID=UPI0018F7C847|nr:olfactory receptor 6C75-like [Tachyglossus aculeatus]